MGRATGTALAFLISAAALPAKAQQGPSTAPEAREPERSADHPLLSLGSPAVGAPGGLAGAAAAPTSPIEISAYAILGGAWVQQDSSAFAVGRNNGFSLADARLELTGRPVESLWLFLSIDGAVPLRDAGDPLRGRRAVELKDAYGVWAPGAHLRIQAGQFKAPQDIENLLEETELRFPTRSIVSDGLRAPATANEVAGLALDRQWAWRWARTALRSPSARSRPRWR